nr:pentatricopeptide repeat-containing protein [Tanacetum cinerariifolium]
SLPSGKGVTVYIPPSPFGYGGCCFDKGNVGDGNTKHKGNASDTNLVDNVSETMDVDMLVVDNVVNNNLVDNGRYVSIDVEVLAKQMKLDKGKSAMTQKDHVISKKRKSVLVENQVNSSVNETDMGFETESDESQRSFDYLSDCDYEVVELRKRKSASKNNIDEGDENASSEHEDFRPPTRNYDIGHGDTIKQHELCIDELMWKLKGNRSGLTDPLTIV